MNTTAEQLFHLIEKGGSPYQVVEEAEKRLKEAGDILGVKIFDFIICGGGCYYSFREHKRL